MNPFDLPGPQFLVVYWVFIAVGLLAIWTARGLTNATGAPEKLCSDVYQLAYLRGGSSEVVRVALLTLVEDGVVAVHKHEFSLASPKKGQRPPATNLRRPPIEEELRAFLAGRSATIDAIIIGEAGAMACEACRRQLEELQFLRSPAQIATIRRAGNMVAVLLGGVAVIKIFVALSRGRHNVGFLITSALVAVTSALASRSRVPLRTARGQEALAAATALLDGAHRRLKAAISTLRGRELAWVAAAFGFSVFNYPDVNFAFWPALAYTSPAEIRAVLGGGAVWSGSSFGSSCGSSLSGSTCSAGSSCGGGGGGGCGGGGGGGGCGGCGGH